MRYREVSFTNGWTAFALKQDRHLAHLACRRGHEKTGFDKVNE